MSVDDTGRDPRDCGPNVVDIGRPLPNLVERLRVKPLIICQEAADEIERLTSMTDILHERLQEALQEIGDGR